VCAHATLFFTSEPLLTPSTVAKEESVLDAARTSYTAFLIKSQDSIVRCIEERVAKITQVPIENIEPFQVLRYEHGQKYEPHFDYFPVGTPGQVEAVKMGGQRLITLFVYMSTLDDGAGGETVFPELGMEFKPIKSDAVYWYDMDVNLVEDSRTLHGGKPVLNGTKWGLNIWIREADFSKEFARKPAPEVAEPEPEEVPVVTFSPEQLERLNAELSDLEATEALQPETFECNTTHKFTLEIVKQDPLVAYIKDFLAPGEAKHMRNVG
jgi:hypothetical protein